MTRAWLDDEDAREPLEDLHAPAPAGGSPWWEVVLAVLVLAIVVGGVLIGLGVIMARGMPGGLPW